MEKIQLLLFISTSMAKPRCEIQKIIFRVSKINSVLDPGGTKTFFGHSMHERAKLLILSAVRHLKSQPVMKLK